MAAQCSVNNGAAMIHHHHHPYISSNAYYGYVPVHTVHPASTTESVGDMEIDSPMEPMHKQRHERLLVDSTEERRSRCLGNSAARKRGFGHDEVAAYMPCFKRFREEAVVTNVFSMMQETSSGQKNVDWPRCTMSRHYYA